MENVSKIVLLFILSTTLACKQRKKVSMELEKIYNSSLTIVSSNSDSSFYKEKLIVPEGKYYEDSIGNLIFLVTKSVFYSNIDFGNNISTALKFYKENNLSSDSMYYLYTVNILNANHEFEPIWKWKNSIYPNENGYSVFDIDLSLDFSYTEFNSTPRSILHLQFKTKDYSNGYKQYTLNYTNQDGLWKLLFREKINTVMKDNDEIGYCIDTVNRNCQTEGKTFELGLESIISLDDRKCY